MAVLGWKYDPGKKVSKCKSTELSLATPKKQKKITPEKTETTEPTEGTDAATTAPDDEFSDLDTDESLPDPFSTIGEANDDLLNQPVNDKWGKSFSTKPPNKKPHKK